MKAPANVAPPVTKQQFVYGLLRDAIIRCELPPGERLVIDELARRFQVSIIPVREALRLLQSEGLVVSVPHVGATVSAISLASVYETFAILEALEVVAARAATKKATDADIEGLARRVSAMDRAIAGGRPAQWADLNTEFHLAIGTIAAMPLLEDMLRRAFDHWDRLRRHYFPGVLARRIRQAQAEHYRILDEIRTRDVAQVEATLRAHNQRALQAYATYLDSVGGALDE